MNELLPVVAFVYIVVGIIAYALQWSHSIDTYRRGLGLTTQKEIIRNSIIWPLIAVFWTLLALILPVMFVSEKLRKSK